MKGSGNGWRRMKWCETSFELDPRHSLETLLPGTCHQADSRVRICKGTQFLQYSYLFLLIIASAY